MERVNSATVNAFQIKRQAHAVSRRETSLPSDRWNPFRHVWAKGHERSQTWDAEAQRGNRGIVDDEAGSPIEQTRTAPAVYDYAANTSNQRSSRDQDDAFQMERTESSGETVVPSHATGDSSAVESNAVRNRKSERDAATPRSNQDEAPKNAPKPHRMFKDVQPKEPFTFANQLQRTLLNSWINVLLIAAPVGIVLGAIPNMNKYAIFVVNFIAIIPLAALLSFATEEIALRTGETLGGLLNASFG